MKSHPIKTKIKKEEFLQQKQNKNKSINTALIPE